MTFEEFCECCSCDMEKIADKTQILVIFSSGVMKKFSTAFVDANTDVAKRLVMHELYGYIKEQFNG